MELDFDNELDRKVSETVAHVATLVEERIMSRENAHHAINALYGLLWP
jgi:argininosuccinate lyase